MEKVIYGGHYDLETRHFEATLMDNVNWDDQVMQQEIFGPILPIMIYNDIEEALEEINSRPKPLALYVFTEDQEFADYVLDHTTSGDAEINSAIIHVGSHYYLWRCRNFREWENITENSVLNVSATAVLFSGKIIV